MTKKPAPSGHRGRPGRRSAATRRDAVLAVLSGKKSRDDVARECAVHVETVERWLEKALEGVEDALQPGGGGSNARERELEREVAQLKETLARVSVERELALKGVEEWKRSSTPTRPARRRR